MPKIKQLVKAESDLAEARKAVAPLEAELNELRNAEVALLTRINKKLRPFEKRVEDAWEAQANTLTPWRPETGGGLNHTRHIMPSHDTDPDHWRDRVAWVRRVLNGDSKGRVPQMQYSGDDGPRVEYRLFGETTEELLAEADRILREMGWRFYEDDNDTE